MRATPIVNGGDCLMRLMLLWYGKQSRCPLRTSAAFNRTCARGFWRE
jgi:hypothetical protein